MCDYCSWIDQILVRINAEAKPEKKKHKIHVDPVIIVHGGAGRIPRKKRERMLFEVTGIILLLTAIFFFAKMLVNSFYY